MAIVTEFMRAFMDIPLTAEESQLIQKASAVLNITYEHLSKGLVALSGIDETPSIRMKLTSLKESINTLERISGSLRQNSYLTDEQIEDIAVIKITIGQELTDAQNLLTTRAAAALDIDPPPISNIPDLRHDIIGRISFANTCLNKVYEMVGTKSEVMNLINRDTSPGRHL